MSLLALTACGADRGDEMTEPTSGHVREQNILIDRDNTSYRHSTQEDQLGQTTTTDVESLIASTLPETHELPAFPADTAESALVADQFGNFLPQTKAPAPRIVRAISSGYTMHSAQFRRLYGPGVFTQNALANTIIGTYRGYSRIVSNRFRATVNGQLAGVRFHWRPGRGYSAGHGGHIRIRLMPDDGSGAHRPNLNAAPLATAYYKPGYAMSNGGSPSYHEITFSGNGNIQAGQLYHFVFDNIDPAPSQNFISINHSITQVSNGRPARWLHPNEWATLLATQSVIPGEPRRWFDLTAQGASGNYYGPIMQMRLRNGQSQGNSDMEGGSVDPRLIFTATSSKPIRERFTPSSSKRVSAFSVATAAAVGGQLQWRLMDGNTVLASGRISQGQPNYRSIKLNSGSYVGRSQWYDVQMSRTVNLQAGRSYDLEFHPQGGSQWKFADHRNGSFHGFTWPAAFTESRAQHRRNGQWVDQHHWSYWRSLYDANWPVVLHLAP